MDEEDRLAMDQPEGLADEPKLEEEAPEPQSEGLTRDEHGRFASKETGEKPQESAPDVPPTTEPEHVPVKALQDERRKRQELEQQIAALQQQFQQSQQPQPADFWEAPEEAIDQRVSKAVRSAFQEWQQQQQIERVNASEAAAMAKYTDYEEAVSAFAQAVQANPRLSQQMMQSPDPGEFAYKAGKRALELERVGSIDDLIKAERAKWEAEARAAVPKPQFPTSTASDGSVASRGGPVWSGPVADSDILPMG